MLSRLTLIAVPEPPNVTVISHYYIEDLIWLEVQVSANDSILQVYKLLL